MADYDVFIVGGGINGCGIARDAAGRGYRVGLAEMNDLASGTSSWSTKLIHGGLRYLEHYEFRLVRQALMEREVLWRIAPHIIRPLRFVLPHHKGLRPGWLLRTRPLPLRPSRRPQETPGDDARRPDRAARRAAEARVPQGLRIFRRLGRRCAPRRAQRPRRRGPRRGHHGAHPRSPRARRDGDVWRLVLRDEETGGLQHATARFLVNVGGPWVDQIIQNALGRNERAPRPAGPGLAHRHAPAVRPRPGLHLPERRRPHHLRDSLRRGLHADRHHRSRLRGRSRRRPDQRRGDRLPAAPPPANTSRTRSTRDDIVWTFSGVRPLFDDGASKAQEATRDYVLTSRRRRRRPAPQRLRRQDHHLSRPCRGGSRADRQADRRQGPKLDRLGAAARAATFRSTAWPTSSGASGRLRRLSTNAPCGGWSAPTAPTRSPSRARPRWADFGARPLRRRRSTGWWRRNGRATRRTSSGGARNSACASMRTKCASLREHLERRKAERRTAGRIDDVTVGGTGARTRRCQPHGGR